MRKALLAAALLTTAAAQAVTLDVVEFVDRNGRALAHGTELTLTEITQEEDFETGEVIDYMLANIGVHNLTDQERALRISLTIDRLDNGSYQICFPMACRTMAQAGSFVTDAGTLAGGETRDLLTEWLPADVGNCDVTLAMELMSKSPLGSSFTHLDDGPTLTLHYRNGTSTPTRGDLNGDAVVDVDDMNIIINMMLGKATRTAAADLNGDGTVDVDDMNALVNIMLGKGK